MIDICLCGCHHDEVEQEQPVCMCAVSEREQPGGNSRLATSAHVAVTMAMRIVPCM
jgi:hypothetical protein